VKDLGWANGWSKNPDMLTACREARKNGEKHDVKETPGPWTCTHRVTCETCGYTYMYDSGD